ncbi:flavin-containing monooxygenase [Aspergillus affinis]|uniref:flavin-containing monooxygenase n=1 Tax=Aspergillus affinis TaxID=1070780 RepID=UPI0022FECE80|nr:FAD/NAD(P)-binding domain-containing protein [Aspergillus affinis]KAI9046091.1 FAD/NAD(P)-binding domain-containing protein [Aspergillus affinis]
MAEKSQVLPFRQVVIIGAGFGGLAMACELKRKLNFHDFIIYERNPGLGGTWYDNNYPGAAADIPGSVYQLSFAPEPNFTHAFPDRQQLHNYMLDVAQRFHILPHLECNVAWVGSTWLEDRKCWIVELQNTQTGERYVQECAVLISAIGHMVDPKRFDVPGKETFQGQIIHSSKWTNEVDLKGKNVVVLGNGSTAVQIVPAILDDVKQCTQIQRAPQWILNRPNPYVPETLRKCLALFPILFILLQHCGFALAELFYPLLGRRIPRLSKSHLRACGVPEKYHTLLTPSYEPGCKRLVFASSYLQGLSNPKLQLLQDEITSLSSSAVELKSGVSVPCDVLVLAHGFESETFTFPVKGRKGRTTVKHWEEAGGPSCYKGCAMNGFPNFFMIRGPNMASGHNSVIYYIEMTVALILKVASPLIQGRVRSVEVKSQVEKSYVDVVQEACKKGVWGRGCSTYYVDGTGWNHTIYPWSEFQFPPF